MPTDKLIDGSFITDEDPFQVAQMWPVTAPTATLTSVADAATSTPLLAENTRRRGAVIHNDSTQGLKIAYAATASSTAYSYSLGADVHWEMPQPIYTGPISGIWASDGSGAARITELE